MKSKANGWSPLVRGFIIRSIWKTFHDFLREYVFMVLGKEWTEEQRNRQPLNDTRS